jgi:hypothetical protein
MVPNPHGAETMTDTTTTTQPAKRARNGSVVLTDRMCQKQGRMSSMPFSDTFRRRYGKLSAR